MDKDTLSKLIQSCRKAGLRNTAALRAVLTTLGEHGCVWNTRDIHAAVHRVDQATIYRLIERLVKANIVRRVALPFREAYYTLNEEHGDNSFFVVLPGSEQKFQCVGVGTGDTNTKAIAQLCNDASAETGAKIVRCEIVFYAEKDDGKTVVVNA